jgi:hypothetical protein
MALQKLINRLADQPRNRKVLSDRDFLQFRKLLGLQSYGGELLYHCNTLYHDAIRSGYKDTYPSLFRRLAFCEHVSRSAYQPLSLLKLSAAAIPFSKLLVQETMLHGFKFYLAISSEERPTASVFFIASSKLLPVA